MEQKRLNKLLKCIENTNESDRNKWLESSVEIRRFPFDEKGMPYVVFPTRLGNLLEAYESYPLRIYGMDSIFYWDRIWLTLDENQRQEIDNQQALADSTVYTVTAMYISGILSMAYAILLCLSAIYYKSTWYRPLISLNITWNKNLPPDLLNNYLYYIFFLLFLSFLFVVLAYLLYRGSMHIHDRFGQLYKALFDVFNERVSVDEVIEQVARVFGEDRIKNLPNKEKFEIAWDYLHNYVYKDQQGKYRRPLE